ncbi:fluoride efflux transporter CrcB [Pseudonocardia sp. NPDC049635]|uniref:fluoride efflux transporter CrcB n=1 Tax=Pseudonocardia sp. NPDC049635 TaxID=3155506 RepID=UPI0033EFE35B
MDPVTFLLVGVGAAVGAPLRYLADAAVRSRFDPVFPWATFAVNAAGSFLLGALLGAAGMLPPEIGALLGTGFCGALTTYSTFGYELVALAERRAGRTALVYLAGSAVSGIVAAAAGWTLARLVL